MKRPSYQWYPGDWRKDAGAQSCSIAARGLWREMIDIAHDCEPYGHLVVNGQPMTPDQIARLAGVTPREAKVLVAELDRNGVFSRTDDGAIYCRRMVRDEDIRERRAAGGEAGKEHGDKGGPHGIKGGRPRKERGVSKPPSDPPSEPPPSSSTSTSVQKGSEAIASGGEPPPGTLLDLKAELWKRAVPFLTSRGVKPGHERALVGKWIRALGGGSHGQSELLHVLASAQANCQGDVVEYVEAAIERGANGRANTGAGTGFDAAVAGARAAIAGGG